MRKGGLAWARREACGVLGTAARVALSLGIARQTLNAYECGQLKCPDHRVRAWAKASQVDYEWAKRHFAAAWRRNGGKK